MRSAGSDGFVLSHKLSRHSGGRMMIIWAYFADTEAITSDYLCAKLF